MNKGMIEQQAMTGDKRAVLEIISDRRKIRAAVERLHTRYLAFGLDEAHLREFFTEAQPNAGDCCQGGPTSYGKCHGYTCWTGALRIDTTLGDPPDVVVLSVSGAKS